MSCWGHVQPAPSSPRRAEKCPKQPLHHWGKEPRSHRTVGLGKGATASWGGDAWDGVPGLSGRCANSRQ